MTGMFSLSGVERRYGADTALRIDSWQAASGEHWLLSGPSGSGKSTALHLLSGLSRPSRGTIEVAGQDLNELDGAALDRWRGRTVGFVPQRLHLVAALTVLENLLLAQYLSGQAADAASARLALAAVRLDGFSGRYPETLSQGQAQRVAVARAVVHRPMLLMADEPTASLDDEHASATLDLLVSQARAVGATLVIASHDARVRAALPLRHELKPALASPP